MIEKGVFIGEMFFYFSRELWDIEGIVRIEGEGEPYEVIEVFPGSNLNNFDHPIRPSSLPTFSNALRTISRCSSLCVAI